MFSSMHKTPPSCVPSVGSGQQEPRVNLWCVRLVSSGSLLQEEYTANVVPAELQSLRLAARMGGRERERERETETETETEIIFSSQRPACCAQCRVFPNPLLGTRGLHPGFPWFSSFSWKPETHGRPGVIRADTTGQELRGRPSKPWKNKHLGADICDPTIWTSMIQGGAKELWAEKLRASSRFLNSG